MAAGTNDDKSWPAEAASGDGGVTAPTQAERATIWRRQHAAAIADYNAMIETNGIPLSEC